MVGFQHVYIGHIFVHLQVLLRNHQVVYAGKGHRIG